MLINVIQVVSAIILVIVILMQNRGAGLGSTFGGGGGAYQTRRSTEKFVFNLTIIVAIIFFATAVINIFVIK